MNLFFVISADNFIWNQFEFVKFLSANQGQAIVVHLNGEGPDATAIGVYKLLDSFTFESVTIITANPLETHPRYNIITKALTPAAINEPVDSVYHTWNQTKIFSAFYGRPIWHRLGLASFLKNNFDQESLITLHGKYNDDVSRSLFELTELFHYAPDQIPNFTRIHQSLPLLLDTPNEYTPGTHETVWITGKFTKQLLNFYTNVLIDIVAEPFTTGTTFFPTEKTFRPIMMKKPFIAMTSMNHMIYLRQMGFRTFHDFWDEDYDGYAPRLRFKKILELITELGNKSKTELFEMYNNMQPILDHNYNLLLSQDFNRSIKLVND